MARWLLPAVCGLALIGAWKMSRAQPVIVAPPRVDIPVARNESSESPDFDAQFMSGTEFKLSKEAAAMLSPSEREELKHVLPDAEQSAREPKPVEASKLHKDAKLGGALDLVEAHSRVAPLYSAAPYVSILPPDRGVALEGPPDVPPFVPTTVFEKDESYGRFECPDVKRSESPVKSDAGYSNSLFLRVNYGIVIDR